ncbi:hypothetical protein Amet_2395 [Alkaliphilus metalliredigens QYMF]|uniref:Uncharacterized protein n=1 Tax=Alkaliphilus metalliredigens (strain QYMF) TaxID=293826 RepID=A6TQT1_ALKMQ|nr:hypothetical protein [Alkaliphilus metalliredigens]ABR48549.1 hypothetical protein Amet_2395 [Alkaliphilus metalliredigens QYMF]
MAGDFSAELNLATLINGELNDEFKSLYQDVLKSLKKGEKGKVTINVHINRIQDMDTMVGIEYDIKSQKPTRRKSSMAVIKDVDGQLSLMTDRPKEPLDNITMLKQAKE